MDFERIVEKQIHNNRHYEKCSAPLKKKTKTEHCAIALMVFNVFTSFTCSPIGIYHKQAEPP